MSGFFGNSDKLKKLNKIFDMNISEITVEFGSAAEIPEILAQSMEVRCLHIF